MPLIDQLILSFFGSFPVAEPSIKAMFIAFYQVIWPMPDPMISNLPESTIDHYVNRKSNKKMEKLKPKLSFNEGLTVVPIVEHQNNSPPDSGFGQHELRNILPFHDSTSSDFHVKGCKRANKKSSLEMRNSTSSGDIVDWKQILRHNMETPEMKYLENISTNNDDEEEDNDLDRLDVESSMAEEPSSRLSRDSRKSSIFEKSTYPWTRVWSPVAPERGTTKGKSCLKKNKSNHNNLHHNHHDEQEIHRLKKKWLTYCVAIDKTVM